MGIFKYISGYFFTAGTKLQGPDDKSALDEYMEFAIKYGSADETIRREAVRAMLLGHGYYQEGIDTGLPVIIYLDLCGKIISHEEYKGRLPYEFIRMKWAPIIGRSTRSD